MRGYRDRECPVLGKDISTNSAPVCQEYKFWQDKPCVSDHHFIRCKSGHSGECVWKPDWGVEGAKNILGRGGGGGCKDGSDLYRPIIVKAEETGGQPSQPDNNEQSGDAKAKAKEPSTPQVWKTRPVAVTEDTCEANDGFVCKVRGALK